MKDYYRYNNQLSHFRGFLLSKESSFHFLWNSLGTDYLLVSASFPVKYKLTNDNDRQRHPNMNMFTERA